MSKHELHLEILDSGRLAVLQKLDFLRNDHEFYLAGGTALALHIGHRTSIDFDFYAPRDFDPKALFSQFAKNFPKASSIHVADGTLMVGVGEIELSFFRYQYPMVKPLVETEHLDLASVHDIAAMKMIAIVQRGTKRDFVDMYYLLKRMSVETLFQITRRKYSVFNKYIGLRSLTYFEDADKKEDKRNIRVFEKIPWEKIKKEIINTVMEYKETNLPTR